MDYGDSKLNKRKLGTRLFCQCEHQLLLVCWERIYKMRVYSHQVLQNHQCELAFDTYGIEISKMEEGHPKSDFLGKKNLKKQKTQESKQWLRHF